MKTDRQPWRNRGDLNLSQGSSILTPLHHNRGPYAEISAWLQNYMRHRYTIPVGDRSHSHKRTVTVLMTNTAHNIHAHAQTHTYNHNTQTQAQVIFCFARTQSRSLIPLKSTQSESLHVQQSNPFVPHFAHTYVRLTLRLSLRVSHVPLPFEPFTRELAHRSDSSGR